jgi:hypothetical protein
VSAHEDEFDAHPEYIDMMVHGVTTIEMTIEITVLSMFTEDEVDTFREQVINMLSDMSDLVHEVKMTSVHATRLHALVMTWDSEVNEVKLITPEIREATPAIRGNEGKPLNEHIITAKFFTPWSNWTWYMTELDNDEDYAFGYVVGLDSELGYFSISELEALRSPSGRLTVERDLHFGKHTLAEVVNGARP